MTNSNWLRGLWVVGVMAAGAIASPLACSSGSSTSDASTCAAPLLQCGSECSDPQSDPNNCGACGTKCDTASAEVCSQGKCALACGGGTTQCNGSCFDLQSDQKNCGTCGNACAQGESCSAGKCAVACSAGLTLCGDAGACVDTQNDALNCGACGNACGPNTTCQSGVCSANLLTTAPVNVSGSLTGCTTASAPLGRKTAIDDANELYVAMICGGTLYVAESTNGGISFSAPVSTGLTTVTEGAITISRGAKPTLYAAATAASSIVFASSANNGATWTTPITLDSASNGDGFGVSMDVYKDTVYVESNPSSGSSVLHVLRNGMGAGDAGLVDASDAGFSLLNLYVDSGGINLDPNEVVVNQSNGDVWVVGEDGTYFLMQSTNGGATFNGPASPPGTNYWTDWVLAKDTIFMIGTGDQLTVIPTTAPTTDLTIGGFGTTGTTGVRSIGVDVGGNVYVATPNGNAVRVDRVLFSGATSDGGVDGGAVISSTRNIEAVGAVNAPSVTARAVSAALVAFTANGAVWASVQTY